ncbi:TonB-dependent receptor [Nitrospirillum pindoramense]|uniref:Outer membrane receptor protein involved in Fe transport n=1 Tax=Nitrospirillum amazonense TaxID=28077 RepID=A0A560GR20_9PROT|nr:TonB-dependent receptor [Nitrospirillum amazonense]TWB36462.1 outer membrane receptor protein involved in Fe transport [Nitrospirillum amazonense]
MKRRLARALLLGAAVTVTPALFTPALADEDPAQDAAKNQAQQGLDLDEIVITATALPQSKFNTSVSVSTLNPDQIAQSSPSSAADILRNIPGFRAEASGGEGNANIAVRGLPVASGGAKFLQLQEDGLPIMQFGDIAFGTADTYLRADYNVSRVEAIRGGSASTFASNAPGGVINFVSDTGEKEGGAIGLTRGLDYNETRADFAYGGPIAPGWRFHVGGYYHTGEGPRSVGYDDAMNGGQVKANVTHDMEKGFIRLDFKYLNDRSPVYLPVPLAISGSGSNPHISSLAGFDALSGAFQSPYFRKDLAIDANGNRLTTNIGDGYHPVSTAFGGEASFEVAPGWTLDDKFRVADNTGDFVGPYPQEVDRASVLATEIGGTGATLQYASGPNAGQTVSAASVGGNGLASRIALFNVKLNDLGTYTNDLKVTKTLDTLPLGKGAVSFGYYKARQNIDMDWHWNTYLETVNGKDGALLNVLNASGKTVTSNGLVAYGEPYWGNCCVRSYDMHYDIDAPYAAVNWAWDKLTVDASLRYDYGHASGSYAGPTGTTALDVNQDGVLQVPELTVPVVNQSVANPVNYDWHYISYSIGANYAIDRDLALFVRYSEGGRANADRLAFGSINADGSTAYQNAVNKVKQAEGGVKWRSDIGLSVFLTGFYANTEEANQDVTSLTQRFISRVYDAEGAELEASYRYGAFQLDAGVTYTHSRITKDEITPSDVGNVPQRQADFVYQITPSYVGNDYSVGVNIIGTTDSYTDTTNKLVMPGYAQVNLFATYNLTNDIVWSFSANNLFNTLGLTEVDGTTDAVPSNGILLARSINGRTFKTGVKYSF